MSSTALRCISRTGLLDRQIEACLVLLETTLPSKWHTICLPIDSDSEFLLFHLLTSGGAVISVLDFAHPNRCVAVSHGGFDLHFPDDIRYGSSFHVLIAMCTSS